MSKFTVVFDACVLYPFGLRDLLMQLAVTDLFRAKWTEEIHDEWTRNLHINQGISIEKLDLLRQKMNEEAGDCLVDGYQRYIPIVTQENMPDDKDVHVVAAALQARADMIVTINLKDFPISVLEKFDIEPQHPDEFILNQLDLHQPAVLAAVKQCRAGKKRPSLNVSEYLKMLERNGLPETVSRLSEFSENL